MILYHAVSVYQLLCLIVHRRNYTKGKKAVLMLGHPLKEKYPHLGQLEHFFDEVWEYSLNVPLTKEQSMEDCTLAYFDAFFGEHGRAMQDFDTIYLGCTHIYFGIYLSLRSIPYVFLEDGAGLLSRPEVLRGINAKYVERHALVDRFGLYDGTGACAEVLLCNVDAQAEGYTNAKMQDFRVVREFRALPEDDQQWIFQFFRVHAKIDVPKDAVMLLTQHFSSLGVMSFQDHVLIYQMVMDYYFSGQSVVIKPHPSDLLYYEFLFPNASIMRELFPAEFLPVLLANSLKTMATISSTAIANLKYDFSDIFVLDNRFEKEFKGLHRLYAALKIAKELKVSSIGLIGVNEMAVTQMIRRSDIAFSGLELTDPHQAPLVLVDEMAEDSEESTPALWSRKDLFELMDASGDDRAFVFLNRKQDFKFHDIDRKSMWENILPVLLAKKQLPNFEFYAQLEPEMIYFYTNNERRREAVNKQAYKKQLEYTGLSVSKVPLSDEQQRIQALEGMLAATEKRLLYYINREKELLKKLEDKQ